MRTSEARHMARVAELECACCGDHGVHVHHLREGQGMGQRASNWLTIPLCPTCHTGTKGIHGDRSRMKDRRKDELSMLADTLARIYGGA